MKGSTGNTHGLVLLDKPAGITSTQCVNRVQAALGRVKAGHAGTLDPFATGLLPICIGRATKLVSRIRSGSKKYRAELRLGIKTDTQDITGVVTAEMPVPETIEWHRVNTVFQQFTGSLRQIPPMYSARKVNGVRLYKLARAGINVERRPRTIEIFSLNIVSIERPVIVFDVVCSEGTYVRTLGEDIACALRTVGVLQALRRTRVGMFNIDESVSMDCLDEQNVDTPGWLLPADRITADLPSAILSEVAVRKFVNGGIMVSDDFEVFPGEMKPGMTFNVYTPSHRFLGLCGVSEVLKNRKTPLKTVQLIDIRETEPTV